MIQVYIESYTSFHCLFIYERERFYFFKQPNVPRSPLPAKVLSHLLPVVTRAAKCHNYWVALNSQTRSQSLRVKKQSSAGRNSQKSAFWLSTCQKHEIFWLFNGQMYFGFSLVKRILAFHSSTVFWLFTRQKLFWLYTRQNCFGFTFVKTIKALHSSKLFWLYTRQNYQGFTLVKTVLALHSSKLSRLYTRQNYFGFTLVKTISAFHSSKLLRHILCNWQFSNCLFLISAQN